MTSSPSARRLALVEWVLLGLAAPLLTFPGSWSLLGVLPIALGWLWRRQVTGRWSVSLPSTGPLVVLMVALALSVVSSVNLAYSMSKFWGIVLGLATYVVCMNTGATPTSRRQVTAVLLIAGSFMAVVGVLGMVEPSGKLFLGRTLYELLPRIIRSVQTSTIETQGFSPNEVGGMVALVAPLAVVLSVLGRAGLRLVAVPTAIILLGVLLLTQSRSAVAGVMVATATGVVWALPARIRPVAVGLVLIVALGGLGIISVLGPPNLTLGLPLRAVVVERLGGELAGSEEPPEVPFTLVGRLELWQRALMMVLDLPLTGIGLNTFPIVLEEFYPLPGFTVADAPHAHDLYLQTALDLGLPGLLAFVALGWLAVRGGLAGLRDHEQAPLALALLLGLLAHGIYSLTDAVALGAKPGALLWMVLGLLTGFELSRPAGAIVPRVRLIGREPLPPAQVAVGERSSGALGARGGNSWHRLGILFLLALMVVPFLGAPLAVNVARLTLHRSVAAGAPVPSLVARDLSLAGRVAWGPYVARVYAAEAVAARSRGDLQGELIALQAGWEAAPWDASLAYQLGEGYFAQGDISQAAATWGPDRTVTRLLELGKASPPAQSLAWYLEAQTVDPADWRPYAAAADVLVSLQQRDQAAVWLAQGLRARAMASDPPRDGRTEGSRYHAGDPARRMVAARLDDSRTPVPEELPSFAGPADAELFIRASRLFESRMDLVGALFAARLAAESSPGVASYWSQLANLWQRVDQTARADEARQRAERLRRSDP